jgi:hypothetical protein
MSVWNKVLLVLIFLCAAGFVYFGAEALKMRRDSQKKLADARKSLEDEQKKNRDYWFGTGQGDGYIFLLNDVNHLRKFRGTRAWPNCLPQAPAVVNGATVTLQLQVDAQPATPVTQPGEPSEDSAMPDVQNPVTDSSETVSSNVPPQNRVLPGTVVYLFDKRPIAEGGCLLGEFTVTKVENTENIATLTSVYPMTEKEIERINDSVAQVAPWAVYTVLPREATKASLAGNGKTEPDVETGTTEPDSDDTSSDEELAQAAQPPSLEALTDPTEDPRPALAQTFESLNRKRIRLQNMIEMQGMQKTALETTQVEAAKMVEFYHKEIEETQAQHKESQRQYAEVKKLYDATVMEIANIEELIAGIKSLNKKMLADLTQTQLRASEIIHERNVSLSMAQ